MKIVELDNNTLKKPLVATIGFFDGVHTGHRHLINQLVGLAKEKDQDSAVITFPIHPRLVLQSDYVPALLCGYEEKLSRLAQTDVNYCIPIDFTTELSQQSAKEFIQKILKEKLNVSTLLIGYDHRFGYNRSEGFADYVLYGKEVGMAVIQASELESDLQISSSQIRRSLAEGDIDRANAMLGYRYTISGQIVEGFKIGRTIGFPTANIKIWEDFKVVPAFGVYAVFVLIDNRHYKGMLYIGQRPTLQNGDNISLEVNIFDFDEDLYGKTLSVQFIKFVRPDEKFPNLESLIEHINNDKQNVINILHHIDY